MVCDHVSVRFYIPWSWLLHQCYSRNTPPLRQLLSSLTHAPSIHNSHSRLLLKPIISLEVVSLLQDTRGSTLMGARMDSLSVAIWMIPKQRLARKDHSRHPLSGSRTISDPGDHWKNFNNVLCHLCWTIQILCWPARQPVAPTADSVSNHHSSYDSCSDMRSVQMYNTTSIEVTDHGCSNYYKNTMSRISARPNIYLREWPLT